MTILRKNIQSSGESQGPNLPNVAGNNKTNRKLPTIYMITPTRKRIVQKADLTRLSQTLRLVPNLHWILVEDSDKKSTKVADLLKRSTLSYTHLNLLTPPGTKGRGMEQRNIGMQWIRKYFEEPSSDRPLEGVVYFGDDDNTYDIRIFEKMRNIKKMGVWAVAFTGAITIEKPLVEIVNNVPKVTGWDVSYKRKFSTDMAGFAINVRLLIEHPTARFAGVGCGAGYFEFCFLNQLQMKLPDIEPIGFENLVGSSADVAKNPVREVLVWHTKTENYRTNSESKFIKIHQNRTSYDGWEY